MSNWHDHAKLGRTEHDPNCPHCELAPVGYEQQKTDPGSKYDAGKLRMDLIPADSLRDLAEVYTFGAEKYEDEGWRKGISWKRIYGAVLRHLTAWFLGEDLDQESGLPHLAHACWGLMTLLNYSRNHKQLDDRSLTAASRACLDRLHRMDRPRAVNGSAQRVGAVSNVL
jgi:hypothetical protein